MGAFGTLGVCTAGLGTVVILTLIGERQIRRILRDIEANAKR